MIRTSSEQPVRIRNAPPAAWLLVASGELRGRRVAMSDQRCVLVGRVEGDLKLPDRKVSARHARFWINETGWYAQDLGSTNGTYINGRRLDDTQRIHDGDTIILGRTIVTATRDAHARPANFTPVRRRADTALRHDRPQAVRTSVGGKVATVEGRPSPRYLRRLRVFVLILVLLGLLLGAGAGYIIADWRSAQVVHDMGTTLAARQDAASQRLLMQMHDDRDAAEQHLQQIHSTQRDSVDQLAELAVVQTSSAQKLAELESLQQRLAVAHHASSDKLDHLAAVQTDLAERPVVDPDQLESRMRFMVHTAIADQSQTMAVHLDQQHTAQREQAALLAELRAALTAGPDPQLVGTLTRIVERLDELEQRAAADAQRNNALVDTPRPQVVVPLDEAGPASPATATDAATPTEVAAGPAPGVIVVVDARRLVSVRRIVLAELLHVMRQAHHRRPIGLIVIHDADIVAFSPRALAAMEQLVDHWLDPTPPEQATRPHERGGVIDALTLAMAHQPGHIYFMTDRLDFGPVSDADAPPLDILADANARRMTRLHTLQLSPGRSDPALRTLANHHGGTFTLVHTPTGP